MIILQIIAFSLQFHLYNIVINTSSVEELEVRLHYISRHKGYSQKCYKEWNQGQFPQHCILLIETASKFVKDSPQQARTFLRNYCKQGMIWRNFSRSSFLKESILAKYPECQHHLQEYLLDKQYKMRKNQIYHSYTY